MNKIKDVVCPHCEKSYGYKRNLTRHISIDHPDKLVNRKNTFDNICNICDKTFKFKHSLRHHECQVHGIQNSRNNLKCPLCEFTATVKKEFFLHITSIHDLPIKTEEITLKSIDEFNNWKQNIEKETFSKYNIQTGIKCDANNSKRHVYICHRSGFFASTSTGKRHLKTQGSKKINGTCPSRIQVLEAEDGTCKVKFIQTHVGHQNEICHLTLSDSEKQSIASDIANKIPFDEILHKVRDSVTNCSLDRIHLLTKKDLYNIEHAFNLTSDAVRHSDDGTSVEAWVNEVNSSEHRSVLFFKPQGTEDLSLKNDDFVLIIMNSAQSELLKKYGTDCICIDETHGMNSYGFTLTTILVIDDLRQGFPCAFLISNRTDHEVLTIFLEFIKSETGVITPNVFMTDMAESFYNAWISVMGKPAQRLFCTWHVDRAWRKNIRSKVQGQEKQAEIYKLLRILLQEREKDTFWVLIAKGIERMCNSPDTELFGKYFKDFYFKNFESWAYCYRINSGLNTNMHIERMHKTLKYIYLHGKNVKRLDKAIHGLMTFVKDKLFDRLIVMNKGKVTSKITAIRKRHKLSLELYTETVIKEQDAWLVPSNSSTKELYVVQESGSQCQCKLLCSDCDTCMHRYTCSCIDSCIKWNMCKHVHLICRIRSTEKMDMSLDLPGCSKDANNLYIHFDDENKIEEAHEIIKEVNQTNSDCKQKYTEKNEQLKARYLHVLNSIQNEKEYEICKKTVLQLEATINAVRSSKNNDPLKTCNNLVSKKRKIEPQRRLLPKKKSKQTPRGTISTPNEAEVQAITMSLLLEPSDNTDSTNN